MHTRTFGLTNLYAALPAWALGRRAGQLAAILRDPAKRDEMRGHRSILSAGNDWSRVVLLDNEIWPEYSRRDLASIAADRGQEPLDAVYDLLLAGVDELHKLMVIIHAYSEDQQREAFAHRALRARLGCDHARPDGPLPESFFHGAYTWAAWFWRFMVRDERLLTPEEAVHRLTGQPAERVGLARPRRPPRGRREPTSPSSIRACSPSVGRSTSRTCWPRACATCSSTARRRCRTES